MILASILKAADQAARWHEEQRRKGLKGEPYVNHLLEVGASRGRPAALKPR